MTANRALVVCVGNSLAGDDAAGCAVYDRLRNEALPGGARLLLLGIDGTALLEELAGEKLLIVVDAVRFGAEPGTIHVLDWNELPAGRPPASAHEIGLEQAIALGRILTPDAMPSRILLIGIEGSAFAPSDAGMTAQVSAAVEDAAQEVHRQLRILLSGKGSGDENSLP